MICSDLYTDIDDVLIADYDKENDKVLVMYHN